MLFTLWLLLLMEVRSINSDVTVVDLKQIDCQLFLQQKMGLFGIGKELQFGACNHAKPGINPMRQGESSFKEG